ncbi:hypothetical protein CANARDRAFT_175342 [[Candida] arabinofermentans NRRL YB-2248]|uniref:Uncharacterized protein n=1 Tax=[Candida] arabinofermentans NRRL YB-2248 TaxID=983967 RepID=A0A1E4T404_9ASCO|nr:hypothetical protein CANARDRAFT_175342 [[Candida] arabinofermentans NRRL YB-2248]
MGNINNEASQKLISLVNSATDIKCQIKHDSGHRIFTAAFKRWFNKESKRRVE